MLGFRTNDDEDTIHPLLDMGFVQTHSQLQNVNKSFGKLRHARDNWNMFVQIDESTCARYWTVINHSSQLTHHKHEAQLRFKDLVLAHSHICHFRYLVIVAINQDKMWEFQIKQIKC